MNWDALGAIGEIVGAFAVVATLIYLARQIKTQNRESRIASVHEVSTAFRRAITSFMNPNLSDIFVRAKTGFTELSEPERLQFVSMVQQIFRVWEEAYYQYEKNRLDERIWKSMVVQFSFYLSLDGVRRVWEIRKQAYSDDFREFVDNTAAREYLTK